MSDIPLYISTSCIPEKKIGNAVRVLAENGYTNIELSGGTNYYDDYIDELQSLKQDFSLHYLIHNYFPPPKEHFVLNLASLDDTTYSRSIEHCRKALKLCAELNVQKYAVHAGFYIPIETHELGAHIHSRPLYDKTRATDRFCSAINSLQKEFPEFPKIYIENNVLSNKNYTEYNSNNPLMLTTADEYEELKNIISFNLLLDIAHLKVSSNTLSRDFTSECQHLIPECDYIHISDNNGFEDGNDVFSPDSSLYSLLSNYSLKNKTFTLEVYGTIKDVKKSYNTLRTLINNSK